MISRPFLSAATRPLRNYEHPRSLLSRSPRITLSYYCDRTRKLGGSEGFGRDFSKNYVRQRRKKAELKKSYSWRAWSVSEGEKTAGDLLPEDEGSRWSENPRNLHKDAESRDRRLREMMGS
jgi:hypothetical protein